MTYITGVLTRSVNIVGRSEEKLANTEAGIATTNTSVGIQVEGPHMARLRTVPYFAQFSKSSAYAVGYYNRIQSTLNNVQYEHGFCKLLEQIQKILSFTFPT